MALTARAHPLVAPLSDTEFVIFGGDTPEGGVGDGYIFNAKQRFLSKVFEGNTFKFSAPFNQCCAAGEGKIAGLTHGYVKNELHLMTW